MSTSASCPAPSKAPSSHIPPISDTISAFNRPNSCSIPLSLRAALPQSFVINRGRDIRIWLALTFGLIHGFGFANVLREMELPPRALGWSLFSFNFGVEVGQLLIVSGVATALTALRHHRPSADRAIVVAGSIAPVAAGGFWFVQRVFFAG